MEKFEGETREEFVKRLFKSADEHILNIETQFKEMKEKGIIGFCSECGCNLYSNKEHTCSVKK